MIIWLVWHEQKNGAMLLMGAFESEHDARLYAQGSDTATVQPIEVSPRTPSARALEQREHEQKWQCERCEGSGTIPVEESEGLMSVVNKIDDAHRNASPKCSVPVSMIRVHRQAT